VGKRTYAIASDLSGVIPTDDGFGSFDTELDAFERLIEMLDAERATNSSNMAHAKRQRRALREIARG
jgi:hypothetical protein